MIKQAWKRRSPSGQTLSTHSSTYSPASQAFLLRICPGRRATEGGLQRLVPCSVQAAQTLAPEQLRCQNIRGHHWQRAECLQLSKSADPSIVKARLRGWILAGRLHMRPRQPESLRLCMETTACRWTGETWLVHNLKRHTGVTLFARWSLLRPTLLL